MIELKIIRKQLNVKKMLLPWMENLINLNYIKTNKFHQNIILYNRK